MGVPAPHFVLYSEANRAAGDWRFVIQAAESGETIEVADAEPEVHGERLELLAAVRALESLERPSRVTLVTSSRYVSRGINNSLEQWKEDDYQWEFHGELAPVKNADLWRRVGHALEIHQVRCRLWRIDGPEAEQAPQLRNVTPLEPQERAPTANYGGSAVTGRSSDASANEVKPAALLGGGIDDEPIRLPRLRGRSVSDRRGSLRRRLLQVRRWTRLQSEAWVTRFGECGTGIVVTPWLDRGHSP